jgi:hypothetical protein
VELQSSSVEDDIAAAITATETPPPASSPGAAPPPDAPVDTTAAASEGERARDDSGRFAKKPAADENQAKTAPTAETAGAQQQAQTPTAAQQPAGAERVAPPVHWKGGEKVNWDKLPKPVQQAIADDYTRFTQTETQFANLRNVLAPVEQNWRLNYGSTEAGLRDLLQKAHVAATQPEQFIAWLAQSSRIDLASLAQRMSGQNGTQDGQQFTQQHQQPLTVEQVRQLTQQTWQEQENQRRQAEATAEIQKLQSDPAYPYFNDVRLHMKALLESGAAQTLKDAYDAACWANPTVRTARLQEETTRKAADEAERQREIVAKARRANGSITGSPTGASIAADGPNRKTTEEEVRYQVERLLPQ